MDADDLMADTFLDLDLNQETMGSLPAFRSSLEESETAGGGIEGRIRQVQAVAALTRRCQTGNSAGIGSSSKGRSAAVGERGKGRKRESSPHLVAKALEVNSVVEKDGEGEGGAGSIYDCNTCLKTARDPVLTCCGHLFCWECFYNVSYVDSTSKDCPVCEGEVSDSTVIPIYGNGCSSDGSSKPGLVIPPRPKAQRVESEIEEYDLLHTPTPAATHVLVEEAIRRIRIGIDAMEAQTRQ